MDNIKHDDKIDTFRYFRPLLSKTKPISIWSKIVIALVGALLLLLVLQGIVAALNSFFGTYDVQVRSLFQSPFVIEKRIKLPPPQLPDVKGVETEPEKKPAESMVSQEPSRIVNFIWTIESSKGKAKSGWHVNCRNKGKWNELGYGGPDFCFETAEEGFATVEQTIRERLAQNSLLETLCVYNNGFNRDENAKRIPWTDCDYYQNYLKFIKNQT